MVLVLFGKRGEGFRDASGDRAMSHISACFLSCGKTAQEASQTIKEAVRELREKLAEAGDGDGESRA